MSRELHYKVLGALIVFTLAIFFTACAASSHVGSNVHPTSGPGATTGTSGSSSGTGGSGGSGGSSNSGTFAAGIGGAGQATSAHFLVGVQVPGSLPVATRINPDGTLSAAKVNFTGTIGEQNPMAMAAAIDPSGSFLYEPVQPGIWVFSINRQTGDLTALSTTPIATTQNFEAIAVDQMGKFVYAYGGGQVFAYSIQPGTGQLLPIAGSPIGAGTSGEQFAIPRERVAVSQNDKFLYVATKAGIMAYTIDPHSGALTLIAGSPFGGAAGPALAVVAPATGYLYETISNTTGSVTQTPLSGYSIDPDTGVLTSIPGSPFTPGCSASNLTSPASGKFLFAAGCGMYQIDASTGALTHLFNDPSTPNSAWAVFDPAGAFLWMITVDQNCWHCDEGVTSFQFDPMTGKMTMVPNSFFVMQNDMTGAIASLAITH